MKWIKILAPFLLIILAGAAIGIYDMSRYPDTVDARQGGAHTVVVEPGEGFRTTAQRLHDLGLIQSPLKFRLFARFSGFHRKIQAGEFQLYGSMTPRQILETLVEGKVLLYRVTIPEGFTLQQIAQTVSQAGFGDADAFYRLATNPEVVREQQLEGESLEGYLFPDTYYFPKGFSQGKIIHVMIQRFRSAISDTWLARANTLNLSLHQVVTLASIIEKETGAPAERPLIASVFHNRLKKGMRLETDPTVIYGIKDFDGNLTRKHLRTATPYNTYVIKGLPPGPIASPGHAALEAALYPADTDYLFFVSRKDRTHQFSSNLKDHQKAVRKYQLRRKRKTK